MDEKKKKKTNQNSVANKYTIYFMCVAVIANGNDTELMMVAHKATISFKR